MNSELVFCIFIRSDSTPHTDRMVRSICGQTYPADQIAYHVIGAGTTDQLKHLYHSNNDSRWIIIISDHVQLHRNSLRDLAEKIIDYDEHPEYCYIVDIPTQTNHSGLSIAFHSSQLDIVEYNATTWEFDTKYLIQLMTPCRANLCPRVDRCHKNPNDLYDNLREFIAPPKNKAIDKQNSLLAYIDNLERPKQYVCDRISAHRCDPTKNATAQLREINYKYSQRRVYNGSSKLVTQ
jgi:hypothetical protein